MYSYRLWEWLLFFFLYCFIGWCWETTYVSVKERKFINRGFLYGPVLPIYGAGAVMMLAVSAPFQEQPVLIFLAGVAGATILELVTGMLMEILFQVRYWDYSHKKFHYRGYICLSSSLTWGFFTIIMTRFLHRQVVEPLVLEAPPRLLNGITIFISCYIVIDFAVSISGALNLRKLLDRMEEARKELMVIERRLDAIIAFYRGIPSEKRDGSWYEKLKMEELRRGIEERFHAIRTSFKESKENTWEEMERYFKRVQEIFKNYTNISQRKKLQKNRIFDNPTMVSKRYQISLNELKQMMADFRRKKKN